MSEPKPIEEALMDVKHALRETQFALQTMIDWAENGELPNKIALDMKRDKLAESDKAFHESYNIRPTPPLEAQGEDDLDCLLGIIRSPLNLGTVGIAKAILKANFRRHPPQDSRGEIKWPEEKHFFESSKKPSDNEWHEAKGYNKGRADAIEAFNRSRVVKVPSVEQLKLFLSEWCIKEGLSDLPIRGLAEDIHAMMLKKEVATADDNHTKRIRND